MATGRLMGRATRVWLKALDQCVTKDDVAALEALAQEELEADDPFLANILAFTGDLTDMRRNRGAQVQRAREFGSTLRHHTRPQPVDQHRRDIYG